MRIQRLSFDTAGRRVIDITDAVLEFGRELEGDGLLAVFLPHATAGLALIETGAGSEADLEDAVERLVPRGGRYRHAHGSAGHGGDHVLPAFVSPSLLLVVDGGVVVLGRWQRVVIIDPNRDNNRRQVLLSTLPG